MTSEGASLADHIQPDAVLTPDEVAEILKVKVPLLYKWRCSNYGPPSFKAGKYLRYRRADLSAWIARQVEQAE